MEFTDTHTHLYDSAFAGDIDAVMARATAAGVHKMVLPNEDSASLPALLALCERFPGRFLPLVGVHPTSITSENLGSELDFVEKELSRNIYAGIGEIGLDLYWDKSCEKQQLAAFHAQLTLATHHDLPVSIHSREAMDATLDALGSHPGVRGVLHCFSGTYPQARRALDAGLALGIGGTVTYKNNPLREVLLQTGYKNLVLETDAPYLAPVPYRGKRNESAHMPLIAAFLASLFGVETGEIARAAQSCAKGIFGFTDLNIS